MRCYGHHFHHNRTTPREERAVSCPRLPSNEFTSKVQKVLQSRFCCVDVCRLRMYCALHVSFCLHHQNITSPSLGDIHTSTLMQRMVRAMSSSKLYSSGTVCDQIRLLTARQNIQGGWGWRSRIELLKHGGCVEGWKGVLRLRG